jgi:hypothetical protein
MRATKDTPAGRKYLDLQREARRTTRPTDELIQLYPLEMLLAEKIVTAIARGTASSRWRDFVDIYMLVQRHSRKQRLDTAIPNDFSAVLDAVKSFSDAVVASNPGRVWDPTTRQWT